MVHVTKVKRGGPTVFVDLVVPGWHSTRVIHVADTIFPAHMRKNLEPGKRYSTPAAAWDAKTPPHMDGVILGRWWALDKPIQNNHEQLDNDAWTASRRHATQTAERLSRLALRAPIAEAFPCILRREGDFHVRADDGTRLDPEELIAVWLIVALLVGVGLDVNLTWVSDGEGRPPWTANLEVRRRAFPPGHFSKVTL